MNSMTSSPRPSHFIRRRCGLDAPALAFHHELPLGPAQAEDPVAIPIDELHRPDTELHLRGYRLRSRARFATWSTVSSTAHPAGC